MHQVIELIQAEKPDAVCLQECIDAEQQIIASDFYMNGIQILTENTDLIHTFYAPCFSTKIGGVMMTQGNVILSNTPFISTKTVFTGGEFLENYQHKNGKMPEMQNIQLASLTCNNKTFTLANHHGYRELDPLGSSISVEKLKIVRSVLETFPGPYVFCGDFNLSSNSPAMRVFDGLLEDLTKIYQIKSTLSSLHDLTEAIACDHILVSKEIKVSSFSASSKIASDHKALILEFEI